MYLGIVIIATHFLSDRFQDLVWEQCPVAGYFGKQVIKNLVFHGHTAHQCKHRFFIGHSSTHTCLSSKITVETFYPIGGVNHGLYLRGIVQISHINIIVGIARMSLNVR